MDETLLASSSLAWIVFNKFKTERDEPIEFVEHRWAIDYLTDNHPHKVSPKAAQAGMTVLEFMDDFHLVGMRGMEVAHTFHTTDILQKIVRPKVNPLINNNPIIKAMMTVDSEGLKGFGKSFLHIIGANAESQAISFSADVLKIDEKDRSNPIVVEMLESRLKHSKYKWVREFSNPSAMGVGVDASWKRSDMRHWFVRCSHCNHFWYIDFEPSADLNHYVDRERRIYACGKCKRELHNRDRINGEWVAKYPSHDGIHGYWISQLMCAWISAGEICDDFDDKSIEYFHNFVLGKAYTPTDMFVSREAILRACAPSNIARSRVAIGVDQDAGGQYYVALTAQGVFDYGYVDSWDKIEHLKLMYNAVVVCDPNPYSAIPKQMAGKYSDWYLCYFKILDGLSAIQWKDKEQVVYADRTRVIDIVANEIVNTRLLFRQRPQELEKMIGHWDNIYRTTEEKEDGRVRSVWMKKEGKQSDYPFALTYARIGLTQLLGGNSELLEPKAQNDVPMTNITADGNNLKVDFSGILKDTYEAMDE